MAIYFVTTSYIMRHIQLESIRGSTVAALAAQLHICFSKRNAPADICVEQYS